MSPSKEETVDFPVPGDPDIANLNAPPISSRVANMTRTLRAEA